MAQNSYSQTKDSHDLLITFLADLKALDSSGSKNYRVPEFLIHGTGGYCMKNVGHERDFFVKVIENVIQYAANSDTSPKSDGITYQCFIRCFASLNSSIGTALKQIAFLPFLKERLGVSRIVFLPTSQMGKSNKKGVRGSPFAVRNPFEIDESLADPLAPDISATDQYRILIAACKHMGISVGSIVPLTTLAIDSPLFESNPRLGYWWKAVPGELLFAKESTSSPYLKAQDEEFISLFVDPPDRARVVRQSTPRGEVLAIKGKNQTLANALPHPIAGDPESYTWSDVSSVRYSVELTTPPQGTLQTTVWDYKLPSFDLIPKIIEWRRCFIGEEFFLIDVNSSLPREILRRAKHRKTFFIGEQLWDFDTRGDELSGVVGPIVFAAGANWSLEHECISALENALNDLADAPLTKEYFAGISNHDTRPAPAAIVAAFWAATWLLPGATPFIFSGSEHGCSQLVNKEFGFTQREMKALSNSELALFNDIVIDWSALSQDLDLTFVATRLLGIKRGLAALLENGYRVGSIINGGNNIRYVLEDHESRTTVCQIAFNLGEKEVVINSLGKNSQVFLFGAGEGTSIGAAEILVPGKTTAVILRT